jgi:hypothetical protein
MIIRFIFVFLLFFKFTIGKNEEELKYIKNYIEKDLYKEVHNIEEDVTIMENCQANKLIYFIPICEENNTKENSINYSKCLVSGIMNLFFTNTSTKQIISLNNIIFDIVYEKLIFTIDNKNNTLSFNFILQNNSYNMNLNKSEFENTSFKNYFRSFESKIEINFSNRFKEILYEIKNKNKKEEFNAILSLYFLIKPYIYELVFISNNTETITYFKPFNYKLMNAIVTKNKLKAEKLIIYAEYSINYDLNYNEVEIIFENFCYEEKKMTNSNQTVNDIKNKKRFNSEMTDFIIYKINKGIDYAYKEYFKKS